MLQLQPAPASVPPGRRVYAIGDIHGCLVELRAMYRAIADDLAARPVAEPMLVHLGDYVDRGPDSAGVVALVAADGPAPTVNLMGNHERMMLDALAGDRAAAADWLFNGGGASLRSWGADPAWPQERWAPAIPTAHRDFLAGLRLLHREGGYVFVHAGVRPSIPLSAQTEDDLLFIREPFLHSEADFGAVIVHGHTPKPTPQIRHNRIGIDTGLVYGGALTCLVLEAGTLGLLQIPAASTMMH